MIFISSILVAETETTLTNLSRKEFKLQYQIVLEGLEEQTRQRIQEKFPDAESQDPCCISNAATTYAESYQVRKFLS